jgi:hypothetical protein
VAPDAATFDAAERHGPSDMQSLDVIAVDLIQWRIALSGIVVVVVDPVILLLRRIKQSLLCCVVGGRRGTGKSAGGKANAGNRSYELQPQ